MAHTSGTKKAKKELTEKQKQAKAEKMAQYHKEQASLESSIRYNINQQAEKAIQSYKKKGRPLALSDELKREVIDRIANGQSLTSIAALPYMPSPATIIAETERDRSFLEKYTRARLHQADVLFHQCLDIADDTSRDVIEQNGNKMVNHAAIQRDRLKIETRFRMAGKFNGRYADKAALVGEGASVTVNNLSINPRDMTPDSRDKLRKLLIEAKGSVIDN